jgi:hypothetical protein
VVAPQSTLTRDERAQRRLARVTADSGENASGGEGGGTADSGENASGEGGGACDSVGEEEMVLYDEAGREVSIIDSPETVASIIVAHSKKNAGNPWDSRFWVAIIKMIGQKVDVIDVDPDFSDGESMDDGDEEGGGTLERDDDLMEPIHPPLPPSASSSSSSSSSSSFPVLPPPPLHAFPSVIGGDAHLSVPPGVAASPAHGRGTNVDDGGQ